MLASGDIAVASAAGTVILFKGDNTGTALWTKTFAPFSAEPFEPLTVATGPVPSVDATGLVLVTTGAPSLIAYKVADGTVAWTFSNGSPIDDVVVGEGGYVYVLTSSMAEVHVIDVATGLLRFSYTGFAPGTAGWYGQLFLRDSRIFINFKGQVTSFRIPSKGYDPTSPWPVRFHDNQRTNCATSPMTY
jgi:outer membrane protein assembly factor BamB